ncbi:MAG: DUF389 domain-containing protein [Pirellulaceae bacterium]
MAIFCLLTSPKELKVVCPAVVDIARVLDSTLVFLLPKSIPTKKEDGGKGETTGEKNREAQNESDASEDGAIGEQLFNVRSDIRPSLESLLVELDSKGRVETAMVSIENSIEHVMSWTAMPQRLENGSIVSCDLFVIPWVRDASDGSPKTKRNLFNQLKCQTAMLGIAVGDVIEKPLDAPILFHESRNHTKFAKRFASRLSQNRSLVDREGGSSGESKSRLAVVGLPEKLKESDKENDSGWRIINRDETTSLTLGIKPATALWRRASEQFDQLAERWFTNYYLARPARESLAKDLQNVSQATPEFVLFMSVATLLACVGLLQNSPAVIIGAMLVAPLMTPLLGAGLSVLHGNVPGFRQAIRAVITGALVAFSIGSMFSLLMLLIPDRYYIGSHLQLTSEMVSRSRPNLLDPLIGLAGGLAGGFALGREGKVSTLAGVAIAAALVPPIATAGIEFSLMAIASIQSGGFQTFWNLLWMDPTEAIEKTTLKTSGLSLNNVHLLFGPLMLFVINACAVILSTSFGLRLVGMHRTTAPKESNRIRSWIMTSCVFLALVTLIVAPLPWL